jgi:hypothetical protein
MENVKPMVKPGAQNEELKRQIDRDMAIVDMFGGTPPKEIGPELKREIEANLPRHLRERKEE